MSAAVLDELPTAGGPEVALVDRLSERFGAAAVSAAIADLLSIRALAHTHQPQPADEVPRLLPMLPFPLTTMVLNVTNQCNLACTYCYEYGEDRIVDTASSLQPRFMAASTARQSVDMLLEQSGRVAHLTFFGGETLLNFPVLKETVAYARQRAAETGKAIDFSLTTNATMLRSEIIDFLVDNEIGVTVSIDGPRDLQDTSRVFHNGAGSYDVIAPKIAELIRRHRNRPIGARVTLTAATIDAPRIYRHLTGELGFREVGFAPVTTSRGQRYAIDGAGFDRVLGQFRELADEFLECAAADRHHGFTNVKDTLEEIHKGVSKAYPCGAGLGLLGVSTGGDVAVCHRFAGSDAHKLGTVSDGVDRDAQARFLHDHHIADKTDCQTCWARPLCAGGCYHEAHVRYGSTRRPNLHYCEWIRGWTETCLEVYGSLAVRNPGFLARFDRDEIKAEAVL